MSNAKGTIHQTPGDAVTEGRIVEPTEASRKAFRLLTGSQPEVADQQTDVLATSNRLAARLFETFNDAKGALDRLPTIEQQIREGDIETALWNLEHGVKAALLRATRPYDN